MAGRHRPRSAGGALPPGGRRERRPDDPHELSSLLAAIVQSSHDAIIGETFDGMITSWNAAAERLFGYSAEEAVGRSMTIICPPGRADEWRRYLDRIRRGEPVSRVETTRIAKDGRPLEVFVTVSPVADRGGRLLGASAIIHDVSDRKQAERALKDSERRFRATFEQAAVGIAHVRPDGRWIRVNEKFSEIVGYGRDDLLTKTFQDVTYPEDLAADLAQAERLLAGEIPNYTLEKRYVRKDSSVVWASLTGSLVRDADGAPDYFVAVVKDVTARREAEASLAREHEFREQLIQAARAVILVLDPEGRVVRANRYLEQLTGRRVGDAEGRDLFETIIPKRDRESLLEHFAQALRDPEACGTAISGIAAEGRERRLEWSCSRLTGDGGEVLGLLCVGHDVTDRLAAEAAVRESEQRLRAIVDTAADAILTVDPVGRILSFNPAAEQMFGYPAPEAVGRDVGLLVPPPERAAIGRDLVLPDRTGAPRVIGTAFELEAIRKDGTRFPVELTISDIGGGQGFTAIVRDVSERAALQRQVLTVADEEHRRIGQDLHDDVGQELTGLGLTAETLAEALEDESSPDAGLARRLVDGLQRSLGKVRALSQGLIPVEVDAEGLMSALTELAARVDATGAVRCSFECPRRIRVDDNQVATQLYRIAQEAVTNAVRHARATKVRVTLESPDGVVTLRVRDDGVGIAPEPRRKSGGLGIMRYRAASVGATLRVMAAERGGTEVVCEIDRRRVRDGR